MSPAIFASCPRCTDQILSASDITLCVWVPTGLSRMAFTCPTCKALVAKDIPPGVVDLLCSAGVVLQTPPKEALEAHDGPPINLDDLLRLRRVLTDRAVGL